MSYPLMSTDSRKMAGSSVLKLRINLADAYLSTMDMLRALEAQHVAAKAAHRQRLRAELDAIDIVPLTNLADQRW